MKDKLTFEAIYPHPPERVWQALTDSKALGFWLMPTNFQPILGFRFRLDGPTRGGKSSVEGVVCEIEEAKRLSYTWDDEEGEAGAPSLVTWTLRPKDGGTHLRLEHQILPAAAPYVLIEANMNWRLALYASLPVLLALLRDKPYRQPVPIVYVADEPQTVPSGRAGFRLTDPKKEEALCN